MQQLPPLVEVGFVQKTHGFRGELKCVFHENYHIVKGDWLFILIDEKPVPFLVESFRGDGSNPILKFKNTNDTDVLNMLLGKAIQIQATAIDDSGFEEGGLQSLDLVGFDLCDEDGNTIGSVTDYLEHPGQDLIVASIDDREVMIPVHETFILGVDLEHEKVLVYLPEDLKNLNN